MLLTDGQTDRRNQANLFCYEKDCMMSLSEDKQHDIIDAFTTTSRYLDDILNMNNIYFDNVLKLSISHFLDDDVPRFTSYGVYISHLIRFARAFSHVADLNTRNKLLNQKFYRRYYDLISKFHIGLKSKFNIGRKSILRQGLS